MKPWENNHIWLQGDIVYFYKNDASSRVWHRLDGPAIVRSQISKDMGQRDEYWIHDHYLLEKEFNNHPEVIKYRNYMKLKEALGL